MFMLGSSQLEVAYSRVQVQETWGLKKTPLIDHAFGLKVGLESLKVVSQIG